MKSLSRLTFTLLSIVAMFATMLPQTLWACPMTGHIGMEAMVCQGKPGHAAGAPCTMRGKCCKPLTVPPSPDDDDSRRPHVFAAASHAAVIAPPVLPVIDLQPYVAPASVSTCPEPSAVRVYLARFNNSPPPWWPQYRPTSLAGRAPPVL